MAEHGVMQWRNAWLADSSHGTEGSSLVEVALSFPSAAGSSNGIGISMPVIAPGTTASGCSAIDDACWTCGNGQPGPTSPSWRLTEADSSIAIKERIIAGDKAKFRTCSRIVLRQVSWNQ